MSEVSSAAPALTARQREWLKHLEAWQSQDGSLKTYALSHGLSLSGLYTAKREFKRRGIWQGREATRAVPTKPHLVPVRVNAPLSAPVATAPVLRVLLPSGIVIELPEQTDAVRCRALLGALLGAPL